VAKLAAIRPASRDRRLLEDAERLIDAWNERQAKRMPMLFSPTFGAAITARYWFLWVRCPACRTINAVDLRTLDRHRDAALTGLIPALSCRSCRPNARSLSLCGCHGPASQMKCAKSASVKFWEARYNKTTAQIGHKPLMLPAEWQINADQQYE